MAAQEIWLRLKKDLACPVLQTKARTANGSRAGGVTDRSSPALHCPSANPSANPMPTLQTQSFTPILQPQTCIPNPSANPKPILQPQCFSSNPSANPMPILLTQTFSPNPSAPTK